MLTPINAPIPLVPTPACVPPPQTYIVRPFVLSQLHIDRAALFGFDLS